MSNEDEKLSAAEIIGFAVFTDDVITAAERAKVSAEKLVAWLRKLAQQIEQASMKMPDISDEEAGEKWRLKQVEKVLSLFEDVHGRPARSPEELEQWAASPEGQRYIAEFSDKDGHIIPD